MTPEMWGIFLQIVILLAFGYFFTKKKILTSDIKNGLSTLLLKLVLPISILGSSQIAYDASTLSGFGITLVISFVFYFVFLFILRMVAKRLPLKDNAVAVCVRKRWFHRDSLVHAILRAYRFDVRLLA